MANRGKRALSCAEVRAIRRRHAAGETQAALAAEHGLWQTTVSQICSGKTYRECGGPRSKSKRWWNPKWDFVLGRLSDIDIADMTGFTHDAIRNRRVRRGIPPHRPPGHYDRD